MGGIFGSFRKNKQNYIYYPDEEEKKDAEFKTFPFKYLVVENLY